MRSIVSLVSVCTLVGATVIKSVSKTPPVQTGSLPNFYVWGCLPGNVSADFPFCDSSKTVEDRLDDLIGRLTTEEKIGLMSADSTTHVSTCNFMDSGVMRLGIPHYMQLVETNTAVASTCLGPYKCSTNYPGPTGLGGTFNRTLWWAKGHAMGQEMRAFNNLNWYRATDDAPYSLIGLNGYGPNINIARDPRYGRTSELPGEDPFLSGTYAVNMVRGAQGLDEYDSGSSKYLKTTFGLKHYALYSVEEERSSFIPNVTAHDLWETFLPQYALGFSHKDADGNPAGGAMGTMCSYAGLNGVPSCANDYLLNTIVRGKFGRPDVVVGTDCGAVNNMVYGNQYASSSEDAAQKACNGGSDMELGDSLWAPKAAGGQDLLNQAIKDNLVTSDRLDESVRRILNVRFLTGSFDPLVNQPYTKIGAEAVNSTAAQQLNLEAALQSFVLLKNDNAVLPIVKGKKTALLGPHVFSTRDLMSDYKGDEQCAGGGSDFSCFSTIATAFTNANGPENTVVSEGVDLASFNTTGIAAAIAAAKSAEQVILFIGIGNTQEHEGIDRQNISLPGYQEMFTNQVLAVCKQNNIPAAVVLINGGVLGIDSIVPAADAIVEAFYPSVRGADALAMTLFGEQNRWGKLPVTMYPENYPSLVSMTDFDMSKGPGRTYKYYTGQPLFPFGHGMSYSDFSMKCSTNQTSLPLQVQCTIELQTGPTGDEVLMMFHRVSSNIRSKANHPVPIKELVGFDRVTVSSSSVVTFDIGPNQLGLVNKDGDRVLVTGEHYIDITNGVANTHTVTINVKHGQILDKVPAVTFS